MKVSVHYFAGLRDRAGCNSEEMDLAEGTSLTALYAQCCARHGIDFPRERLRVALDDAFVSWDHGLHDGAQVAFLPPVSGG
ncbi:MAG: molybdopterin synthase sulfur carrier subunit [Lysobacterales bacterium CG17_big_fil_post_rev_8_21_14_2_50_64_11]|nr:MAG: molybdopterin synthase sulfur carrier subunit [Xanthomonadales bacterium CG17_big_fil_post_rev_8_21_14_2_50_64_11]PIX60129.1 MAG: molybdopterin synthase sulfur carrier subunit [Xanthomonadales bacterium CG_4_10_14_3_um_filter_64_11]